MMLLTKEIKKKMPKLYANDAKEPCDIPVICKFFTPWSGWTWWVTEGEEQEDGDWLFFGLVQGMETELGYFTLNELASVTGPGGLKIERDRNPSTTTLEEAQQAARSA